MSEPTATLLYTYSVRVLGVVVLLLVAWIVAAWVRRLTMRAMERGKVDQTIARFGANVARYLILVMAVLACLGMFGVETTSFAAVLGAAGLAIGLAFQGSLSNLASGVMLLVFRPFKVGDVVSLGGTTGKIDEIELFTTKMITPDNRLIIFPNRGIFGSTIENVTHFDTRRVDVDVGVDYGADIDRTREILLEAARSVEGGMSDPEPAAVLAGLGASSVDYSVRLWAATTDYWPVKDALTRAVKMHLDKAEIGIPFPQMDVHLDPPPPPPDA